MTVRVPRNIALLTAV